MAATSWVDRAGRFRSLGDGQVDFGAIFSKMAANDFDGWAVVEWECCLKHPEDGAREGAQFVSDHIIRVTERAFDDFADGGTDDAANRKMLGLNGAETWPPRKPAPQRRRIRLGMVGGGRDAFIGGVHRIASASTTVRAGRRRVLLDAGKVARPRADLGARSPDRAYDDLSRWPSARRG
jgi:hypothetical protein